MDFVTTTREGNLVISVIEDDGTVLGTVTPAHVNFKEIHRRWKDNDVADEDAIRDLVNPVSKIATLLGEVSDKFTYEDDQIQFDGSPVLDTFANQLVRVLKETDDDNDNKMKYLRAVAKFGEKLMGNTSFHVRNQLFKWVSDRDLTITEEGDFLAYKGVVKKKDKDEDGNETEQFVSVFGGPANLVAVDGEMQPEGQVANPLGSTITMDKRHINDDHSVGCSQGLHAGTYQYAKDFGKGGLLMVAVNPADVVTVPSDCGFQKLRCAKYRVLEATEYEYTGAVYSGTAAHSSAMVDDDLCPNCGSDADPCDDGDGCYDCSDDC